MKLIGGLIDLYQKAVSPWLGGHCRFVPSCSEYFRAAVERRGPVRGSWRGILRILRCQPFSPGGWDPELPGRGR
jgi:putative membrane protein insertion efficiency factor